MLNLNDKGVREVRQSDWTFDGWDVEARADVNPRG